MWRPPVASGDRAFAGAGTARKALYICLWRVPFLDTSPQPGNSASSFLTLLGSMTVAIDKRCRLILSEIGLQVPREKAGQEPAKKQGRGGIREEEVQEEIYVANIS